MYYWVTETENRNFLKIDSLYLIIFSANLNISYLYYNISFGASMTNFPKLWRISITAESLLLYIYTTMYVYISEWNMFKPKHFLQQNKYIELYIYTEHFMDNFISIPTLRMDHQKNAVHTIEETKKYALTTIFVMFQNINWNK